MKRFIIFVISGFMLISINIYGQNTYTGTIVRYLYPCTPEHPWIYLIYGFETLSGDYYVLTVNSHQIWLYELPQFPEDILPPENKLIVEGIEYFQGDNVTITGTTREVECSDSRKYNELEIETIEKWSPNQDFQDFLGTYIIEGWCEGSPPEITLWKSRNNMQLFKSYPYYDDKVFMINDSLYIPLSYSRLVDRPFMTSFTGRGKIENDSIFLKYTYIIGYEYGFDNILIDKCECKGKKVDLSDITFPAVSENNNVYYDATNQVIVIDETLQNQSFVFELVNLQGKVVRNRTNSDNNLIDVTNLPAGIYLYRLLQNNGLIYSGKIVLN